jgi:hypothetical protein
MMWCMDEEYLENLLVAFSLGMCLEEMHVPLPLSYFVNPRQAFYGLLQCL